MSVKNVLLVLMMVVLAGCASKGTKEQDDLGYGTQSGPAAGAQSGGVSQGSVGAGSAFDDSAAAGPRASARNRTVYFDFDSDNIKAEYREIVAGHGRYLAANPGVKVRLEGNTDERGSREYNLALGQKRAEAVRRALTLVGASDAQVEAVSFGEEKPAAAGASEDAYAKNRRVEIRYR